MYKRQKHDSVDIYTTEQMPSIEGVLRQVTYLYDCGTKGDSVTVYPPIVTQKTIIATLPDIRHTQSFWKQTASIGKRTAVRLYMPPWSLDELKHFVKQGKIQEVVLIDRYLIWGGVPRYVLSLNEQKGSIDQAIVDI